MNVSENTSNTVPDNVSARLEIPPRQFSLTEFENRTQRAQAMMHQAGLDLLLLTTEPHVRYFSGFFTQFWTSPTRPWYLIVPLSGKPIAVIPTIGDAGMRETWIDEIWTWSSPCPQDDGISMLLDAINKIPKRFGKIGIPMGAETYIRMPADNFAALQVKLTNLEIADCGHLLHELCSIKSEQEIAKIRYICEITSDSFNDFHRFAAVGLSERELVKRMQIDLLQRGADSVPFMVCGSGKDGYDNIIMGPTDRAVDKGDILVIDTGATYDGYFCDFDRNYAFGSATDQAKRVYELLYQATEEGFKSAKPGATTTDLWQSMWNVLLKGGATSNEIGRMGHGLGAQLTEWPSNTATDNTILKPGMVMTLEPAMGYGDGRQMVHEENILITESGATMLTKPAAKELPIIE